MLRSAVSIVIMKMQAQQRDTAGRYTKHDTCEACGKAIKGEYMSDDETVKLPGGTGLLLCDRKRCITKRDALTVDARVALYMSTVTK